MLAESVGKRTRPQQQQHRNPNSLADEPQAAAAAALMGIQLRYEKQQKLARWTFFEFGEGKTIIPTSSLVEIPNPSHTAGHGWHGRANRQAGRQIPSVGHKKY